MKLWLMREKALFQWLKSLNAWLLQLETTPTAKTHAVELVRTSDCLDWKLAPWYSLKAMMVPLDYDTHLHPEKKAGPQSLERTLGDKDLLQFLRIAEM